MATPETQTMTIDGNTWSRAYTDDKSGWWFELCGPFGELVVEPAFDEVHFTAYWWPPKITHGDPVHISAKHPSAELAMKAAVDYIKSLTKTLQG